MSIFLSTTFLTFFKSFSLFRGRLLKSFYLFLLLPFATALLIYTMDTTKVNTYFHFFYPIIFLNILYSLTETFLCTLYKLIYNIPKIPIPGGLYVNRKKKYAITSTHNPKQNVYKCILQDRVNL